MRRSLERTFFLLLLAGVMSRGQAFSLLGPYAINGGTVWQVERIGYNLPGDNGGPMNAPAGEEYRWNTPNIFYAYDAPFLNFFGTRGMQEIEKAIKILNDLPSASLLNVDDYPMTAERVHFRAAALGLLDLKTTALAYILEEMGLGSSSRWVYCLRNRIPNPVSRFPVLFTVIRRNFDPITAAESSYINGRLWTYVDIFDLDMPARSFTINTTVDPLDFGRFDPIADTFDGFPGFGFGSYFTGLTRDDVGGIKFIYQAANKNFEAATTNATAAGFSIITGSTGGGGGGPWSIPVPLTNATTTNVTVTNANGLIDPVLRFGVDKLNFIQGEYDSIIGQFFTPITNVFVEKILTNGNVLSQKVQRVITVPDFLFSAADLNGPDTTPGIPIAYLDRTPVNGWANDDAIGQGVTHAGPGVINPPVAIRFSNVGYISVDVVNNFFGNAVIGPFVLPFVVYGAFDGSTNEPVIFSEGGNITLQQIEKLRLGR